MNEKFFRCFIAVLISISINLTTSYSQINENMELIMRSDPEIKNDLLSVEENVDFQIPTQINDLFQVSINIYQYLIASQDIPSCIFKPSCSHFGEQAIGKFSVVKGILLTSDRLQRCNNLSDKSEWYLYDIREKCYIDPVDYYISK